MQAKLMGAASWKSFLESGEMHLQVLRELAEDMAKLQSIIFEEPWQLNEVPIDWKRKNITPTFKKENLEDYRLVSLSPWCPPRAC